MASLETVVEEKIGKDNMKIMTFLQNLVDKKVLNVYEMYFNRKELKQESSKSAIVKIYKGLSLKPVDQIDESSSLIIEDAKTGAKYHLSITSQGGMFDSDGENTIYHNFSLERIAKNFKFHEHLNFPEEFIETRLSMSYQDYDPRNNSKLKLEGKKDTLIEKVYEYIKN